MNTSIIQKTCAVFVPSCDPYQDLWGPYFTLFFRYWPDCPYPIYLGANSMSYNHPKVKTIFSNQGTNWSNRVREHVEAIDAEYIMMFLEDFFLQSKINQADIDYCFRFLVENNGHYMRLIQWPGPTKKIAGEKLVGEIEAGIPYRVSTQVAIWKKESLLALMQPNESIWQFEGDGSKRSNQLFPTGFYGSWKDIMTYKTHVVEKGKWFPWDAKKFGRMNIGCDFSKRGIMTKREAFIWRKNQFIGDVYRLLPYSIRKKIGGNIAELPDL